MKAKYVRSGYVMDGLFIHYIDIQGYVIASFDVDDDVAFDLLNKYPLGREIVYHDDIVMDRIASVIQNRNIELHDLIEI